MRLLNLVVAVGVGVLTACSEPRCPGDLIQVGMVCRRCPEGMVAQNNECTLSESEGGTNEDAALDSEGNDDADVADTDDGAAAIEHSSTDAGKAPCFVDRDKDGVGAGMPVDCDSSSLVTSLGFALSDQSNDCDDNNAQRSPRLSDLLLAPSSVDADGRRCVHAA